MLGPQRGVGIPGRHHTAREQGGTSWQLFLASPLRPVGTDAEVQETLQSQAKHRMPGGPRMVSLVQLAFEQGVYVETSPGE